MANPSPNSVYVARHLQSIIGRRPVITTYRDESEESSVAILQADDFPQHGVTTFATITLADHPLFLDGEEYSARLEMVGVVGKEYTEFGSALSTAAFCVINSQWACYPGAIFPDCLSMYEPRRAMKHFYFMPPFLFEGQLETIDEFDKPIAWLLAVPISDEERDYADRRSPEALEELFEARQIDIFDLDRPSTL